MQATGWYQLRWVCFLKSISAFRNKKRSGRSDPLSLCLRSKNVMALLQSDLNNACYSSEGVVSRLGGPESVEDSSNFSQEQKAKPAT